MALVLDPKLREIVERLGSGPRLHTVTVAEARAASVARPNASRSESDEQMPLLTAAEMAWGWRHYLARPEDGVHPYASPLQGDARGLAPAIIVTAEHDLLRDEGDAYAAKLRDAGVAVRHLSYPGMVHGFLGLFGELPAARAALDEVAGALRDSFAG